MSLYSEVKQCKCPCGYGSIIEPSAYLCFWVGLVVTPPQVRMRDDAMPLAHVAIAVEGASATSPDLVPLMLANAIVGSYDVTYGGGKVRGRGGSLRRNQYQGIMGLPSPQFCCFPPPSDRSLAGLQMTKQRITLPWEMAAFLCCCKGFYLILSLALIFQSSVNCILGSRINTLWCWALADAALWPLKQPSVMLQLFADAGFMYSFVH